MEQRQGLEEEDKKEESGDNKKGSQDDYRESQKKVEKRTPSSISCQSSFSFSFWILFIFYCTYTV